MGQPRGPFSNRSQQKTNVSAAESYSPPIGWVQMVTAGNLVMAGEDGVAVSYTSLPAGAVIPGPFSAFTSTTATQILLGDGSPPPPLPVSSVLGSTTAGNGADAIGYPDASSKTAETTVGGAIDEIYVGLLSNQKCIPIPLGGAIDIATGALLAVFANGASTTPGTQFTDSKTSAIRWNNDAAPGAIAVNVPMPQDLDDAANVVFHALVSKTGATLADATKLTVGAYEHIPGALHDADADFGGDTGAVTGDATAKTVTELTLTFTAANIHAAPSSICLTIKPKAGTLGTDDFLLHSAWLEYTPVLLAS